MGKAFDDIDEFFNGENHRTRKGKSSSGGDWGIGGSRKPKKTTAKSAHNLRNIKNGINSITQETRSRAGKGANGKKLPQVMVKVTGGSKGCDKTQAHVTYIGRNGEVEVTDQDGEKYKGKDQKTVLKAWEAMGINAKDEEGKRRESFNFVFSMPNGTDPDRMREAVKNLVAEEFAGHKWFMAQHLDTDSPHCHVIVCATDDRGSRLNPRKADLHRYRVQFVNKLAEQGIKATASRKVHRFKYQDSKRQGVLHRDIKAGKPYSKPPPTLPQRAKIEKTHRDIQAMFEEARLDPDTPHDIKLAIDEMLDAKADLERSGMVWEEKSRDWNNDNSQKTDYGDKPTLNPTLTNPPINPRLASNPLGGDFGMDKKLGAENNK